MGKNCVRLFANPFMGAYERFSGAVPTLDAEHLRKMLRPRL